MRGAFERWNVFRTTPSSWRWSSLTNHWWRAWWHLSHFLYFVIVACQRKKNEGACIQKLKEFNNDVLVSNKILLQRFFFNFVLVQYYSYNYYIIPLTSCLVSASYSSESSQHKRQRGENMTRGYPTEPHESLNDLEHAKMKVSARERRGSSLIYSTCSWDSDPASRLVMDESSDTCLSSNLHCDCDLFTVTDAFSSLSRFETA